MIMIEASTAHPTLSSSASSNADAPSRPALVGFIDSHRDRFGVDPVCAVLEFPASTYYAAKKRERQPSPRCAG
jgi:hypothetical protein